MSQSLAKNLVHLIYSTKHREARLDDAIQPTLWAYKAGILQQWESPALVIGGVADHVHILFLLSKNHALKKIVEEVKKGSSKWLKTQGGGLPRFPLAERLRRLFSQPVERHGRAPVHRDAEGASLADVVPRRVPSVSKSPRNRV